MECFKHRPLTPIPALHISSSYHSYFVISIWQMSNRKYLLGLTKAFKTSLSCCCHVRFHLICRLHDILYLLLILHEFLFTSHLFAIVAMIFTLLHQQHMNVGRTSNTHVLTYYILLNDTKRKLDFFENACSHIKNNIFVCCSHLQHTNKRTLFIKYLKEFIIVHHTITEWNVLVSALNEILLCNGDGYHTWFQFREGATEIPFMIVLNCIIEIMLQTCKGVKRSKRFLFKILSAFTFIYIQTQITRGAGFLKYDLILIGIKYQNRFT